MMPGDTVGLKIFSFDLSVGNNPEGIAALDPSTDPYVPKSTICHHIRWFGRAFTSYIGE